MGWDGAVVVLRAGEEPAHGGLRPQRDHSRLRPGHHTPDPGAPRIDHQDLRFVLASRVMARFRAGLLMSIFGGCDPRDLYHLSEGS